MLTRKRNPRKFHFKNVSKIFQIKSAMDTKYYWSTWLDWYYTLRKNIKERYTRKNSLEHRHVYEIFQQWLTAIQGNPSNEITNALRNVVVEEFKSVDQNLKPLNQSKSDRFMIDLSLNSRSGYDIAASLNLAYDEVASSSEEDQLILHKKRGRSRVI